MKKMLALLLAAFCVLGCLTACGSDPDPKPEEDSSSESRPEVEYPQGDDLTNEEKAKLLETAEDLVDKYFTAKTEANVPEEEKILTYEVNNIKLMAGGLGEYCVFVIYEYTQTGNHPNANGSQTKIEENVYDWGSCYMEFRIALAEDGETYEIIDTGTGGGGQDLEPISDPVTSEAEDPDSSSSAA